MNMRNDALNELMELLTDISNDTGIYNWSLSELADIIEQLKD